MEEILELVREYGNQCVFEQFHRTNSRFDKAAVCEQRAEEKFEEIKTLLTKRQQQRLS
jgi:hypothetical protein